MNSIMDKLGDARRWAARAAVYPEDLTRAEEALIGVIRAVEMLAMEREDKPAGASIGYGALPTANEGYARAAGSRTEAWEASAQAVLCAFGPTLAKQAAVNALGRVRERARDMMSAREEYGRAALEQIVAFVDAELASLEAPEPTTRESILAVARDVAKYGTAVYRKAGIVADKPSSTSDHVHELGSCSFCDKQDDAKPTNAEISAAWHGHDNYMDSGAAKRVRALFDQRPCFLCGYRPNEDAAAKRAEPSPK